MNDRLNLYIEQCVYLFMSFLISLWTKEHQLTEILSNYLSRETGSVGRRKKGKRERRWSNTEWGENWNINSVVYQAITAKNHVYISTCVYSKRRNRWEKVKEQEEST